VATNLPQEWHCTRDEVTRIVAELRPMIDRLAARSTLQLDSWASEDEAVRLHRLSA
jgi:hypothetical protein